MALFIKSFDAALGPLPLAEIRRLYDAGHFSSHTLVSETGEAWVRIDRALAVTQSPALSSAPFGFVTTDDGDDYSLDDDGGGGGGGGGAHGDSRLPGTKAKRSSLSQVKSTVKNIGTSLMGKDLVRGLSHSMGKRRVSLNDEDLAAATASPAGSFSAAALPSQPAPWASSPSTSPATAVMSSPPALWRSSSTPTKRALRVLSSGMAGRPGSPPSSPRAQSHDSAAAVFGGDGDDDPADALSSVRALALALSQAVDHVDRLEASMKKSSPRHSHAPNMREVQLESENDELKQTLKAVRALVAERAPQLTADVDTLIDNASAESPAASAAAAAASASSVAFLFKPVPFESDSPMLRERMGKAEAYLDELRQALKVAVKSGQAYVQQPAQGEDKRSSFAADLARSGPHLLELVGQVLLAKRDEGEKLLAFVEAELVLPLATFANLDLKRANHLSAELDRRREAFEGLESRLLAHRRGKESRGAAPRAQAALEDGDKTSVDALNAEVTYELARCQLIKALNDLTVDQAVEINKCVLAVAGALSRFYANGAAEAARLMQAARRAVDGQAELLRSKEAWDRAWQVKWAEIEARRQFRTVARPPARRADAEPDLIFEGWLFKRSSNVIKDWKKRFFQLKAGQFVYFRSGRQESVADLLMCAVKDAPRHGVGAFEVVSNTRAVVLQAASDEDKDAWIQAIRRAVERQIGSSSGTAQHDELLSMISPLPAAVDSDDEDDAPPCADCASGLPASWVSLNLGVFLCIDCSGQHRALGSHVSKVRSVHMDTPSAAEVAVLRRLGNGVANRVWEERAEAAQQAKAAKDGRFAQLKYAERAFVDMATPVLLPDLFRAAAADDVPRLLWFVAHDAPLDARGPALETPLHAAAHAGNEAACAFLLLNGARSDVVDAAGRTALDVAKGTAARALQAWGETPRKVLVTEAL